MSMDGEALIWERGGCVVTNLQGPKQVRMRGVVYPSHDRQARLFLLSTVPALVTVAIYTIYGGGGFFQDTAAYAQNYTGRFLQGGIRCI